MTGNEQHLFIFSITYILKNPISQWWAELMEHALFYSFA